jgi:hypothetical protein
MKWVLFAIIIQADGYGVMPQGPYLTMEDCFEARDFFLATAPKPKLNYEAVCVPTDKGNAI